MRRGRPLKVQQRNIQGLKNQGKSASPGHPPSSPCPSTNDVASEDDSDHASDEDSHREVIPVHHDGLKLRWEEEENESGSEDGDAVDDGVDSWDDEQLTINLVKSIDQKGDGEWLPPHLRWNQMRKKVRPKTYGKGPSPANKAARTLRDPKYRRAWQGQTSINSYFQPKSSSPTTSQGSNDELSEPPPSSDDGRVSQTAIPSSSFPFPPMVRLPQAPSAAPSHEISPDVVCLDSDPEDRHARNPSPTKRQRLQSQNSRAIPEPTHTPEDRQELVGFVPRPNIPPEDEGAIDDDELERIRQVEREIELMPELSEADAEAWEIELEEDTQGLEAEVRSWGELQEKITKTLKDKTLTRSKINQLTIIGQFARLRLKGYSRMKASALIAEVHKGGGVYFARKVRDLARHYQTFEDLPVEKRGGYRIGRSWLHREEVRNRVQGFLKNTPTGKVTPAILAKHVNETIFPELDITPKFPLGVSTARRWLFKLGWRHATVRKGVYMDGHERDDVVKYRKEVFIPRMLEYEKRMAHYDKDGNRIAPTLQPGQREMIALYHDESCIHGHDYHTHAWLQGDSQPLRKKGRGRLIHVSDFINSETGRLIIRDASGKITQDARTIIYPGSSGSDKWWDADQLIEQVKKAITIFDTAHNTKQGLFVFDQSSAHASLPDNALRAFDMNKSNGGKQRHQRDTVIPMNNPTPEYRGRPQKMTLPNGQPKGLQQVLEERGFNIQGLRAKCSPICPLDSQGCCMARLLSQQDDFKHQESRLELLIHAAGHECIFLPKFHCELNPIEMYWGWVKYRYRQVEKKTFNDAKEAAMQYLDACPVEVIRRFINRCWRFVDAYRRGLTGKAAEWAVRKQKGHRTCSGDVMNSIDVPRN